MPEPTAPSQQHGRNIDMSTAPGADLSFDELFPVEDGNQQPPQAAPEQTPAAAPQATPPPEPEFYLKAGQSVYKSREEAEQGLSYKDSVIDRLRQFAISQTGFDPLTNKAAGTQPQAQPPQQQQPQFKYLGNGKGLYDDLSKAVERQDPEAYERTMRQYQTELLQQTIGPAAPLLGEVARQRAIREVSSRSPEFGKFIDSTDYRDLLDSTPMLKQAIEYAEGDFSMAPKLGELYQLAYLANQGRRRPTQEVTPVTPTAPVQSAPAARPTTQSSTMTPPSPGVDTRSWATNAEARGQLIKDMENRGIKDIKW